MFFHLVSLSCDFNKTDAITSWMLCVYAGESQQQQRSPPITDRYLLRNSLLRQTSLNVIGISWLSALLYENFSPFQPRNSKKGIIR